MELAKVTYKQTVQTQGSCCCPPAKAEAGGNPAHKPHGHRLPDTQGGIGVQPYTRHAMWPAGSGHVHPSPEPLVEQGHEQIISQSASLPTVGPLPHLPQRQSGTTKHQTKQPPLATPGACAAIYGGTGSPEPTGCWHQVRLETQVLETPEERVGTAVLGHQEWMAITGDRKRLA